MFKKFLSNLAYYFNKENDLSDVTVSLIYSSYAFKSFFLKYFFGDKIDIKNVSNVIREVLSQDKESRVDIFIEMENDQPFLIEVKIGDTNHHFGQYEKSFNVPSNRLGYIVNYNFKEVGYDVKQWDDLYFKLLDFIDKMDESEEKQTLLGYAEYVKKVCGIYKFEGIMNFRGLYSMYGLFKAIERLCKREEEDFTLDVYSTIKGNTIGIKMIYFHLTYKNSSIKEAWGNIGLWYDRPVPLLCIGFENSDGWGKSVYDIIDAHHSHNKTHSISETSNLYYEDGAFYFEATDTFISRFENCKCNEDQEIILKDFIDEAIRYPLSLINK